MALNKEIWQATIVENLYADNSFAAKSVDDSSFVDNHKVHIPNAGSPSKVEVNRSTVPATAKKRTDNDLEYTMDELTTDPVYIPNIEMVELSYDKRNSVIANDRAIIMDKAHVNLLERWGGGVDTTKSVLMTTGTGTREAHTSDTATGQRKKITKADVLSIMTQMDKDNIPEAGRYLLLDACMYADLLEDLSESDKLMFWNLADVQRGVIGNLYGFDIMKRSTVLRIDASSKAIISWNAAGDAGELAAALAWQEQSVSRALGEVHMFDSTDNPLYYGDIYSFLLRTGGAVRRYDKKGVYLLAEAASA